jgi:hypothetical protein
MFGVAGSMYDSSNIQSLPKVSSLNPAMPHTLSWRLRFGYRFIRKCDIGTLDRLVSAQTNRDRI